MDRAELEQLLLERVCVPEYFSNYDDAAVLISILEDAPDNVPFQDYLIENDFEDYDVWEPFENWEADNLMEHMRTLASSIVDVLIEKDLVTHVSLRKT
jgi:hypothetical protein